MMTDETDSAREIAGNVVPFARPRPQEAPPAELQFVELRLDTDDCSLTMSVCDEAGDVVVLKYTLACAPLDFDLGRLRAAWSRWRGTSAAAS
jgi:hypothetical protein